MTLETFWYEHADAAGAALIVAVLATAALCLVIHRYERLARAQRAVYRARLAAVRATYRKRIQIILDARPGGLDEHATRAMIQARSTFADAYVFGQTVADVPSPYAPAFYDGREVAR